MSKYERSRTYLLSDTDRMDYTRSHVYTWASCLVCAHVFVLEFRLLYYYCWYNCLEIDPWCITRNSGPTTLAIKKLCSYNLLYLILYILYTVCSTTKVTRNILNVITFSVTIVLFSLHKKTICTLLFGKLKILTFFGQVCAAKKIVSYQTFLFEFGSELNYF